MRFATLNYNGTTTAAADFGSHYRRTPFGDVSEMLRFVDGDLSRSLDELVGEPIDKENAQLVATTLTPTKVICLGLNYADHVAEMGRTKVTYPTLFAKFPETLTGPYDDISIPQESGEVDWEVELGVVIGRAARRVPEAKALEHVAGFVVVNDVSMRDFQTRTSQFLQGKMWEATTPVGPVLTTPDECDFAEDLEITCLVDGEVVQSSRTSMLLTTIPEAISYISTMLTLRPGDLILTGTPSGVGAGRVPKVFLRSGQLLESRIEAVGSLSNRMV